MKKIITSYILIMTLIASFMFPKNAFAAKETQQKTQIYFENKPLVNKHREVKISGGKAYLSAEDLASICATRAKYDDNGNVTIETDDFKVKLLGETSSFERYGQKMSLGAPLIKDGDVMFIPVIFLISNLGMEVSWDEGKKYLLINSDEEDLKKDNSYEKDDIQPKIKTIVGEEIYSKLAFDYVETDIAKNDKYLPDGEYFVFKSYRRAYPDDLVKGFYFYNILTNDFYCYSLGETNGTEVVKYEDSGNMKAVEPLDGGSIVAIIANAKFLEKVNSANETISSYNMQRVDKIGDDNKKLLPKDREFYFYQAYSLDKDGKKKTEFELAQDKNSLDVYAFLKGKEKTNIIKF